MLGRKLFFAVVVLIALVMTGCSTKTKVALMTKLEIGSADGVSEVDSVRFFLKRKGIEDIEVVPYSDGWNPKRVKEVYKKIREDGIDIIITSHTSTCAIEMIDAVENDKNPALILTTASTTDRLSKSDDYMYRVIQDVEKEQRSIARHISSKNHEKLLVIKDTVNYGYTDPAEKYFGKYYNGAYDVMTVDAGRFEVSRLEEEMSSHDFDVAYLLIGDFQTNAGVIAQLAMKLNKDADIYYTPWMKTPHLLDTAGRSIEKSVMASHYAPRGAQGNVDWFVDSFMEEYGYVPNLMSLNVYKAMDIIHQNIEDGNKDPDSIKKSMDRMRNYDTDLGTVHFDEFGDVDMELYFIEDIKREFE